MERGVKSRKLLSQDEKNKLLRSAVKNYETDAAILLLESGANPNYRPSKNDQTTFRLAVASQLDLDVIRLMLNSKHKVNINEKDMGQSILHDAIIDDNAGMVKLLLEHGASINSKDNDGDTALHMAVYSNYLRIVEVLLNKGAWMHVKNQQGLTPLDIAGKHSGAQMMLVMKGKFPRKEYGTMAQDLTREFLKEYKFGGRKLKKYKMSRSGWRNKKRRKKKNR